MLVPGINDPSSLFEYSSINDRFKRPVSPHPQLDRVVDAFVFQLEGAAVIDIGADVFGIGEYLVNG